MMRRSLDALERGTSRATRDRLTVLQFKGGQSNPTYKLNTPADLTFCAASRSASCCRLRTRSIASSASSRPGKQGLPVAPRPTASALTTVYRLGVLHHVDGGRAACSGTGTLPSQTLETGEHLDQQIETLASAPRRRSGRQSGSAISASPAIISRARSIAGPSNTSASETAAHSGIRAA